MQHASSKIWGCFLDDVLNDYIVKKQDYDSYKSTYKPARFYPTNPSDENAGLCNIIGNVEAELSSEYTVIQNAYDNCNSTLCAGIKMTRESETTNILKRI